MSQRSRRQRAHLESTSALSATGFLMPNVRAKPRAEAGAAWPRKDNDHCGLERPGGGCRSASA